MQDLDIAEEKSEITTPLPRYPQRGSGARAASPARLRRMTSATFRLLLNWGVLVLAVALVLVVRHRLEADARAPLPPPAVRLSAADARQWQAFPSFRRVVPVLLYHGINSSGTGLSITPQAFAEQMLALRTAGFHAITLAQYVNFVHGHRGGLPSKPILLTFDDGRLSTYRITNDILRKYGFHATLFTFGAWPTTYPSFSLTWAELRTMRQSGIWSVAEQGGSSGDYVAYNAAGEQRGAYAFRQYISSRSAYGVYPEGLASFLEITKSSILWGEHQFAAQLPDFQSLALALAVPGAGYGQLQANDRHISKFMPRWLKQHFSVVFGGDYLDQALAPAHGIMQRAARRFSFRVAIGSRMSLPGLYCRLSDWVARRPVWKEYTCLRLGFIPGFLGGVGATPAREPGRG